MIDEYAKDRLHQALREIREVLIWKLDSLSEYDARRPLTKTGTNLLGLVKHRAYSDARYLGEIFDRPFPGVPRWNEEGAWTDEHWATEHETQDAIVTLYRRVWAHTDATINTLPIDAPGRVPWWPEPDVTLFSCMLHVLNDTTRHAGHADILREQLDGAVGTDAQNTAMQQYDATYWAAYRAKIEQAAKSAATTTNA